MKNKKVTIEDLQLEIEKIKVRNKSVESNKSWETSWTRKIGIALVTYITISIFFIIIKVDKPYVNAIVPVLGFILSTLTLDFIKVLWSKYIYASK